MMSTADFNYFCKDWKGANFCSDVMSDQCDEGTESCSSAFENEGNQNDSDVGPFMRNLFEKQLFTDVTFFSNGGNKESISAHRAVLAAKCDFFKDLLFGDQKNEAVGMEMQVGISNVPFSIFTNIVKYFYTDYIKFTDDYTILEIYAAAESFQIQPLIDRCSVYAESMELSEDNVCSTLQICNFKHIEGLKRRCINYIEKNTLQVIDSKDFQKCSFSTVREICDFQRLNLPSEVRLLEAVLRWVNIQPKHTKKDLQRSLLKCIRFLSLTPKQFSDIMQRQPELLKPEDGLKILMYLNNPTPEILKTLPNWCNKCQRSYQITHKGIEKDLLEHSSVEARISVSLKPPDEQWDIKQLTSAAHMKCIKGKQQIKSIQFSFEDVENDGSLLADILLKIHISPHGPTFFKNHVTSCRESKFIFSKGVTVFVGQVLYIEAAAKINGSCRFLQYHKWYNDPKWDFQCYFFSKPKFGKLNFISEIEYVSL